jgi:tetratricopeptide (TPR) repeat protein
MKSCPLLWRQGSLREQGPLQKSAALEIDTDGAATRIPGLHLECLGSTCRFYESGGQCRLELPHLRYNEMQSHLADSEERWENMLLSMVELTERLESAIAKMDVRLRDHNERLGRQDRQLARESARQHNERGVRHYHEGQLDAAYDDFIESLNIDPEFVEAHNNLGLVETERGDHEAATEHFRRAIELDPELAATYTNLGYVFYEQGSYVEALAMYEEALDRSRNSSTAWTNLGNAHFKLENLNKAREAWENAVNLDPENYGAARNLEKLCSGQQV